MSATVLFPPPLNPSVHLFAGQIEYVLNEFVSQPCEFFTRAHYNPPAGSVVKDAMALAEVAKAEYDAYVLVLGGECGRAAAAAAQQRGLRRICFITWRDTNHAMMLYDVLERTLNPVIQ